jgi:hypothetical protein
MLRVVVSLLKMKILLLLHHQRNLHRYPTVLSMPSETLKDIFDRYTADDWKAAFTGGVPFENIMNKFNVRSSNGELIFHITYLKKSLMHNKNPWMRVEVWAAKNTKFLGIFPRKIYVQVMDREEVILDNFNLSAIDRACEEMVEAYRNEKKAKRSSLLGDR